MTDLTVAVLGTGNRAADHLQTISRLHAVCRLVGVCDADRDRAAATAAQYGVPGFADLERLLVDARPDLLYVVIPPDGHRAAVEVAAHHGVHIVCETPIAPTLPLADAMIAAAERHRVKLEVAENVWRWPYERLKSAIVRAGLIGQVTQVHLWYRSGSYHGMSTVRKLIGTAPVRARGFARATPVPLHVDRLGRQVTTGPYELGLVEFGGGAVCVYQYPLHHYRGNVWDIIGSEGAIIGSELVLMRDGERQVYPFRQVIDETAAPPVLERVYVETQPPVIWENLLRHLPGGATADEVARADILVGMCQAIQADAAPPYGGRAARADQEVLIAVRESAGRDGAWVDLPLAGATAHEQQLHEAYARRYGHDPLGPVEAATHTFYPRISPAELALGGPPAP